MKTDLLKKKKKRELKCLLVKGTGRGGEVKLHACLSVRPSFTGKSGKFGMADHPICFWLAD